MWTKLEHPYLHSIGIFCCNAFIVVITEGLHASIKIFWWWMIRAIIIPQVPRSARRMKGRQEMASLQIWHLKKMKRKVHENSKALKLNASQFTEAYGT
jgi:hypothetical protein